MDLKFTDSVTLDGTRLTSDGYLVTTARSVRTGIQVYAGSEVGRPDLARVNVYRSREEVTAQDSLQSFSHAPVTLGHPSEGVTADNWSKLAAGEVSTAAGYSEDETGTTWVQLPLVVKDGKAITAINSGTREISAGYTCELVWGDGVAPDGTPYQAQQKNIRVNHVAIVPRARAGSKARIGDDANNWGPGPIPTTDTENLGMTHKTVIVDGLAVETTEAGAIAIAKLQADAVGVAAAYDAEIESLNAKVTAADAALAAKDAEIADLKSKQLSDADLDKAAAARGDLIAKAKALSPKVVTDGKSAAEIKKAVLVDRKIDLTADSSDAYVDAYFNILAKDAKAADATAEALGNAQQTKDAEAIEADALAKANDYNAWRAA